MPMPNYLKHDNGEDLCEVVGLNLECVVSQSVHGAGDDGSDAPPALPAKTALHHLLPPPVPPVTTSPAPTLSSSLYSHAPQFSCTPVYTSAAHSSGRARDTGGDLPKNGNASASDAATSNGSASNDKSGIGSTCAAGTNGSSIKDTGSSTNEVGRGAKDTGSRTRDTGCSTRDTSCSTRDTGSSTRDTGSSTRDTGSRTRDTGSSTRDNSSSTRDTGSFNSRPVSGKFQGLHNSERNVPSGVKKRSSKGDELQAQLKRQSYHGTNSDHPYHHHHLVAFQHYHSLHHTSSSSSSSSSTQSKPPGSSVLLPQTQAKQSPVSVKLSQDEGGSSFSPNDSNHHHPVYCHYPGKPYSQQTVAFGHDHHHHSSPSQANPHQSSSSHPHRQNRTRGEKFNKRASADVSSYMTSSTPSPHNSGSSPHNSGSSPHNSGSSPHNPSSSPHNPNSSPHNPNSSHNPSSSPHNPSTLPNSPSTPGNSSFPHTVPSPHSYLQRSLTSSAILVHGSDRGGQENEDQDPEHTAKVNGNGTCASSPHSSVPSKFSVPGLFKKLRGNVSTNPKLSPLQPAKQTYVHPNKGSAAKATTDFSETDTILQSSPQNENLLDEPVETQKSVAKKKNLKLSSKSMGNKSFKARSDSIRQKENKKDTAADAHDLGNSGQSKNDDVEGNRTSSPASTPLFKGKSSKKSTKTDPRILNPGKESRTSAGGGSPMSPKPLSRAFGKLKFKRGTAAPGGVEGDLSDGGPPFKNNKGGSSNHVTNPLQKSASVGHSMFTSVVQDCGFPRSQKTRLPSASPPPARQQYL
ncbi:hypothetical protein FHG87_019037 [Trinorchestia longiramus]|nr:hypothetical protein FHG87_019037 [Trinorchestia longiramus]